MENLQRKINDTMKLLRLEIQRVKYQVDRDIGRKIDANTRLKVLRTVSPPFMLHYIGNALNDKVR